MTKRSIPDRPRLRYAQPFDPSGSAVERNGAAPCDDCSAIEGYATEFEGINVQTNRPNPSSVVLVAGSANRSFRPCNNSAAIEAAVYINLFEPLLSMQI